MTEYLDVALNVSKIYELYLEVCKDEGNTPVPSRIYRNIFNQNYNMGFHKPKKDICEEKLVAEKHGIKLPEPKKKSVERLTISKAETKKERKNNMANNSSPVLCL
jgi:hypothetical protein